ncbi:hypothetical protein Scep_015903 [Stephania cephalantha]|uniref:HMG box domain-containing protein n=1 Tax=Stephania cephalantha TaxID=152367 RepID=A0AAP0IMG3_9MAGN
MAGSSSSKSNPPRSRKRVEAETTTQATGTLKRARDGSAFTKCEECNKDVPVVLIDMHNCSLDSKIKMNLEAQVVEKVADQAKKSSEKKKGRTSSEPKAPSKKAKKVKDPNMPKRPATAFFLFMDDFRKTFKEQNPDKKNVSVVAKEGGEKWKSMTDEEKKPYADKAAELKTEYEKALEQHKADNAEAAEGSDKEEEEE